MEPLLYLVHRIPYPPNKGDKIRSFNLLRHLAERFSVRLGCFVDSEEDMVNAQELRQWCADICLVPLNPLRARIRSLSGLVSGEALTLSYFRSARLQHWVDRTVTEHGITRAVCFSSPMAQYLVALPKLRAVVDLVDVDSAKWSSYALQHRWPLSAIYRREGERLLQFERETVWRAAAGVLVTKAEVALFDRLAPECKGRVHAIENGVDSSYFAPNEAIPSPYSPDEVPLVFTGAMDYWPNIDAVTWFSREVLPAITRKRPDVRLYVVGMNPSSEVKALGADPRIVVTGRVPDVRPYLQHGAAVVAPLRIARGVQNKVLEAMSMAKPVVASSAAAQGICAKPGLHLEVAGDAAEFAAKLLHVIDPALPSRIGAAARRHVVDRYSWQSSLGKFDELISGCVGPARA
jgi:sugar transferase (PEP-CTERM/EpsH1 system associated)